MPSNYIDSQLDRLAVLGRKCSFSALEDGVCCNSITLLPVAPQWGLWEGELYKQLQQGCSECGCVPDWDPWVTRCPAFGWDGAHFHSTELCFALGLRIMSITPWCFGWCSPWAKDFAVSPALPARRAPGAGRDRGQGSWSRLAKGIFHTQNVMATI